MYRPVLVIAVVVAVAFSGCSKKGGSEAGDSTEPTEPKSTIDLNTTIDPALKDKGRLTGWVHDAANLSIPGAAVALFGTPYYALAAPNGRFSITNITPGQYQLLVSQDGYNDGKRAVDVKASHSIDVDVLLTRKANVTEGSVPHPHDHWAGATELPIMDRAINFGAPACFEPEVYYWCMPGGLQDGEYFIYLKSEPDPTKRPNIVYQGADRMKIDVSIEGQLHQPFEIYASAPPAGFGKEFQRKGTIDSETDSIEFPVSNRSWDPSHFRTSGWVFEIRPSPLGPTEATLITGTMNWKITVYRGPEPIPVEPAHPNFWGDKKNETLLDLDCTYSLLLNSIYAEPDVCYDNFALVDDGKEEQDLYLKIPGKNVTLGTARMNITMTWHNTYPVPYKFGIEYRDATTYYEFGDLIRPPEPVVDEDEKRVYSFDIRGDQCDSPYALASKWRFRWYLVDGTTNNQDLAEASPAFSGGLQLKIEIFKGAD